MEDLKILVSTTPEVLFLVIGLLLYFLGKAHGKGGRNNNNH